MINSTWKLLRRPVGMLQQGDLELVHEPVQPPAEGEVLVRTLYLSLDPTNRLWMSDTEQYLEPVGLGAPMRGVTLGIVEQSQAEKFPVGTLVIPHEGAWSRYQTLSATKIARLHLNADLPLSAYMSVIGPPGLTAYSGIVFVGEAQPGMTVTISAAAGAVGSVAGQIAKSRGCRVIGIAGGPEKCRWLVDELGFDAAIDYKSCNVAEELRRLCPDGIDLHFENVGGSILDAAIGNMRIGGCIALCGLISSYNSSGAVVGPSEFQLVLMRRIAIRGFLVMDFFKRAREAYAELEKLVLAGKLKWKDHIIDGLQNAPDAMNLLFSGRNEGKLMVKVSEV
ncbi:NADP-dependent oxidoreductase [Nitratireductor aestuarii]|uniref:NADP-dependent oxidoreductase n=1 Tax=Nitratireductor aestuarii TaxID=1735103 RepID=UPI001AEEBB1B|nr:NADP-dependent oxidoreductase [Nitratireductor aestuarii]